MSIVFLDFETSGLNPYHDDIIEIAVKQMPSQHIESPFLTSSKDKLVLTDILRSLLFWSKLTISPMSLIIPVNNIHS